MNAAAPLREVTPEGVDEALLARLGVLDPATLYWLSGYTLALARARGPARIQASAQPAPHRLAVVYASQTGQARRVAERLARALEDRGCEVRLLDAAELSLRRLAGLGTVCFVASTHGDGEPPDAARSLFAELARPRAQSLAGLRFAVLALGDSSYPRFCAAGRWLDRRLSDLGAERLLPLAEADLDIDRIALPWQAELLARFAATKEVVRAAAIVPLERAAAYGQDHRFEAELLEQRRITFGEGARDVRHLVLRFAGEAPPFEPGDALGVFFAHDSERVERVLAAAGLSADEPVCADGGDRPLGQWLAECAELTRLSRRLVEALAAAHPDPELRRSLEDAAAWRALVARFQVAEALSRWPLGWSAKELCQALAPLSPRLYSLAGSRCEEGDAAVLTVGVVRTETPFGPREGACSGFLARLSEGERLRLFWEPNPRFRLPKEEDRDLVMIGAGTGIAPFRAFMQERLARGARGRHWLVYGARRLREDFLYQLEWLRWRKQGALHRLSLAFSRDGARRHVQDLLGEEGRELMRWIDGGAAIYVCGSTAMGQGVEVALLQLFEGLGGCSAEAARERLLVLAQEGRYRRDLY